MEYIYLDESGDLGFDASKRNSKYFIITVLSTANKRAVEKVVKKAFKSLPKKVISKHSGVLHCCKEKPQTREKLLGLLGEKEIP